MEYKKTKQNTQKNFCLENSILNWSMGELYLFGCNYQRQREVI